MARSFGTHFVITANTTDDGSPVYLTEEGGWSAQVEDAAVTEDEAVRDARLESARGQERRVCDPYAFKVVLETGTAAPTTAREKIRATGPTTPIRRPDPTA